ncbi:biotin--[acetyl-CoA-carboxylase] ligase [Candidatus Viridilinea mediisalina]|uniref:biotin--[biotin carboxyl-carrier protein] ligase n=1 Tax=Candidatus Viridilinea mediisalina TaxID=2024553 RepID=A0A2A6RG00_9CHLR|nr:biotin--[acetyl-CoA-carboxylase] ligase [Candidatus Viridilinea mediisalina]PDW01805.1 biotin--[acetyl-CoA-carboxylase] ligase [Candidatus Viridilinea mediisalina]
MLYLPESPLTNASIWAALEPLGFIGTLACHTQVASTMDLARTLVQQQPAAPLPGLIVADEQTAGRGRQGRPWLAPPGTALLFSLALRPTWMPPQQGVALVWMLAVALSEAVEAVSPLRPALKWPNDLLVATNLSKEDTQNSAHRFPANWAKTAGILLDVQLSAERIEWAILGCGVNLRAAPPPEATPYPTTSLAAAGAMVERLPLLTALVARLAFWYEQLANGAANTLFLAWRSRLITLGQPVSIITANGTLVGYATDVTPNGSLVVRDQAGSLHTIASGDVG